MLEKDGDCAAEIGGSYGRVHRLGEWHSRRCYLPDNSETGIAGITLSSLLETAAIGIDGRGLFRKTSSGKGCFRDGFCHD